MCSFCLCNNKHSLFKGYGMTNAVPPFKFMKDEDSVDLRAHYGVVAQEALRILWQRKWLIAATVLAGLVIAIIALTQMGPRYTSEALIQANLNPDTGTKSQPIFSLNAAEVVESAAQIIRARSIADAVVARLHLDSDRGFERQPLLSRWLSAARSAIGLQQTALTPRDLAVDALMRQVRVTAEPRSYLISVAVTAADPVIAAKLANAVAVEYLRRQTIKELDEARSAIEHDLTDAAWVYGPRHPTYLRASTKLEQLDARVAALRDASSTEDLVKLAAGHSLIAAHEIMKPSGPNILAIMTLAILAGLSLGVCLARYTPIGFFRPALTRSVQILLFAAYTLAHSVFGIVTAGRAARRSTLLLRPLRLVTKFAGLAGSKARKSPVDGTTEGPALQSEIATATSSGIAGPGAFGTVPSATLVIGEFTAGNTAPADVVAKRPPHWSRPNWRPLLGILLFFAIAGLATVPGDAVSSLVRSAVQRIAVLRMPNLGAWIRPASDFVFAGKASNLPSAADGERRAEAGAPSAASSVAETPAILSEAQPVSVPPPIEVAPPSATAPSAQVPKPESRAPTPAIPLATEPALGVPPALERTAALPSADPRLSAAERAALVARGDALLTERDVTSARLFYERAAEMGDGRAAVRMGRTFDPAFLDRAGIRGAQGDQREALSWYRRALKAGDAEADRLLKTLELH